MNEVEFLAGNLQFLWYVCIIYADIILVIEGYFYVVFFYFVFQCCFWFVFVLYILMTYFDCFELVGRLEFHVYADKMSNMQYFLGDMTRLE